MKKEDIIFLYKNGRKIYSDNFIVFFLPYKEMKSAVVVSKKISKKAVVRNKIKRRVRHICRDMLKNGKYVIVVKKDVSNIEFEKLRNDFKKIINKTC